MRGCGRLFQVLAALTVSDQSPTVIGQVQQMTVLDDSVLWPLRLEPHPFWSRIKYVYDVELHISIKVQK